MNGIGFVFKGPTRIYEEMTTNPKTRRARRRNELQKQKSVLGVAAKKMLMAERAEAWRDVGGFVTDGVLGAHRVRLLESDTYGRSLAVEVDGVPRQARTLRGVARCIAKMVFDNPKVR